MIKKPYGGGLRKRRNDIFTLLHGIKSANQRRKGGLGIKKMHDFNRAMIAKIGWNLLVDIEIVHIWCDPWLLGMEDLKSRVPPGAFLLVNMNRVADLIDIITRSWKENLIRSSFDNESAETILGMSLTNSNVDDEFIWTPDSFFFFFG